VSASERAGDQCHTALIDRFHRAQVQPVDEKERESKASPEIVASRFLFAAEDRSSRTISISAHHHLHRTVSGHASDD